MYDDAWYNSFGPTAPAQPEKTTVSKHRRRESLLKQPSESNNAESGQAGDIADIVEEPEPIVGPPEATIARRAASYGDFYDAAQAQFRKAAKGRRAEKTGPKELKTEMDLRIWYDGAEGQLMEAEDEDYSSYRDSLLLGQSHLDSLLRSTDSTLDLLSSLSESFKLVESHTTAFRSQCQGLLSEQQRISTLADDVGRNLQYYNFLEPMTRRLNAPGAGQFVRNKEFSEMLLNLDSCIDYMQAHPGHRESQTYRSRYRLLLTRALTLVRVHFVTALREIAAEVTKRITDKQLNDTTMSALLYAKFKVNADELKQVGQEIQTRAIPPLGSEAGAEAEYQSLMNELHQSYTATRGKLVLPLVRKKIGEIAMAPSSTRDLVPFARASIGYIRGISLDEYELWREWFEGEDGLYDFLEYLCEPLYDHLRPRIIHENSLPKLCELCTLIQTRYMQDQEEEAGPLEPNQLDFPALINPILEDAQTRLVFRTLAILRDEIENFRPKPEHLDYPARSRRGSLSGSKDGTIATSGKKGGQMPSMTATAKDEESETLDGRDAGWAAGAVTGSTAWYPTLRKAIWLLSRIYRLVNSTVFDDLAHKIVHHTTVSLHQAATQISTKATPADGQLFLIKHLLQLKSQIVAFDIEYVTPEVSFDFSSVTNTFWELRERGGLFNPRNLMRFMGGGLLPRVVENMLDAKVELDGRLRTVINDFTKTSAAKVTGAVTANASSKRGFEGGPAVKAVRDAVEKQVPQLRQKLDAYLEDVRTKETLVGAVQDQVVEDYEDFYKAYTSDSRLNGQAAKKKGKGREDEVWDIDTFAEWTSGVFGVGRDVSDDDGSRSRSLSRTGSGSV